MAYTISLTLDNIYDALHSYLKNVTGLVDDKIVRAYQDNVPTPFGYPFIYMSVKQNTRNATNENEYNKVTDSKSIKWSNILDIQLDFYGQDSMDIAQVVKGLFRDEYSVDFFEDKGLVPLYADEPLMSASEDEKGNFMVRNTMILHFNTHPKATLAQQYFEEAEVVVKNAEVLE